MTADPDPAHAAALQGSRPMKRLAWLTDLHLNFVTPGHVERLCRSVAVAGADGARMASGPPRLGRPDVVMEGGRRVHKSIYIGGDEVPELIERARLRLEEYRRAARWADEVEGYARLAARAGGIARRLASGRGRPG